MGRLIMTQYAKDAVNKIKQIAPDFTPKIGMILGSGLGALSAQIEKVASIPYSDLPNFSAYAIAGHAARLHLGYLNGVAVACLEGRTHFYEGQIAVDVIKTQIRTLKLLGCEMLLTSNAVGSLLIDVPPGGLVLVKDQINLTFSNPLIGRNDEEFGPRFVSMDNAYDAGLRKQMLQVASSIDVSLREGVYLASSGPTFETPAEIRAFKILGADIIGMSTVPETIVARHCGLKVVTVSAVTNFASGLSDEILSHEGTLKGATLAMEKLIKLFLAFIESQA